VGVCLLAANAGGSAAVGSASGRLAGALLACVGWVAGVAAPAAAAGAAAPAAAVGVMGRGLLLGLAALLVWRVAEGVLGGLEVKFFKGEYPPPRNTDKS